MTVYDWALYCLSPALVMFLWLTRRKPPTAKEIAKEVILQQEQIAVEATGLVRCGRCTHSYPDWFTENFGTAAMKEICCLNCSQGMDPPPHGQSEDDYVEVWQEKKRLREQVENEVEQPKGIFDEPPRGDT